MGIGFKGGFTAFMDGWNKAEDRNRSQKRQDEEDAWMKRERDRKIADQEREDKLRDDLSEATKDKTEKIDNFVMAPVDGAVPPVEMTRPQTEEELLRSTERVYRKAGKVPEAIKYGSAAKQLGMEDYATKFGQWRAVAGELPVQEQVKQAIQIFNDSPNAGTIGEPVFDAKTGAVTFDAYNKVTGQKLTKTFADPKKLVDDLHSYYSQGSWNKEQEQRAAAAKEAAKPFNLGPGEQRFSGTEVVATNTNESPTVAAARIRAENGGKPVAPDIVTMKSDNGDYLYDKNSGAVGREVPATEATPEQRPWFGKVIPAKPATPGGVQWKLQDGTPLPGGPQTLYKQLPVNRPQDAAPKAPANSWNDATGDVISNGKVIGKAKTKEEARALLSKQPKPAANSEQALRSKVTGDMGADPAAIAREIQAATLGLQSVKDPASVAQLREYIASLQGQLQNLKG
jgi:hypothetical protein